MKIPSVLAVSILLLARVPASAQGLIAFPWKECPKIDATEFRCVWVAVAEEVVPMRPREHTDRTFEMRFMNPGSDPARVVVQVRPPTAMSSHSIQVIPIDCTHISSFARRTQRDEMTGTLAMLSRDCVSTSGGVPRGNGTRVSAVTEGGVA